VENVNNNNINFLCVFGNMFDRCNNNCELLHIVPKYIETYTNSERFFKGKVKNWKRRSYKSRAF